MKSCAVSSGCAISTLFEQVSNCVQAAANYLYNQRDSQICCHDDLWTVSAAGGVARRPTAGRGECSLPRFSPDGKLVAYASQNKVTPTGARR